MKNLIGSKIISYNKVTGDVVVGTFTGLTSMPQKMYVIGERPTFFVLNKSKTRHQTISLDCNVWQLLPFNPGTCRIISNIRKIKRKYMKLKQQADTTAAIIKKLRAKQHDSTNLAYAKSRSR